MKKKKWYNIKRRFEMRVKEMGLRGRTIDSPKQPVYVGEVQYCPYCFLPLEGDEDNPLCPRCRIEWV